MPLATYATAYRRTPKQRSHVLDERLRTTGKHRQSWKGDESAEGDTDPISSPPEKTQHASILHPVSRKDPYYIAGYAREEDLPPPPFPYAAIPVAKPRIDIDAELCKLNPPIFTPADQLDDSSNSLKRRHLDNLTAILQSRILKRDWRRASRVFGLMLRTEVLHHVDIRHHDRWTLAGEILLHRHNREESSSTDVGTDTTEHGCKSARNLYERMILYHPYSQRLQHSVNAAAIYPALFNVWIYEVQHRSNRAITSLQGTEDESIDVQADNRAYCNARLRELDEAHEVATRLDDLLAVPPYDTDSDLRRLRSMVALWIADLCKTVVARATGDTSEKAEGQSALLPEPDLDELRRTAVTETELSTRWLASSRDM